MSASREDVLLELSRSSTLLVLLRALYSLMLDYGVYLPDDTSDVLIFSKEQLATLVVERGRADALIRDLPDLAAEGLFRPIDEEELDSPESLQALVVERRGARVIAVEEAVSPPEPEYPVWWEAPIPFAMCARDGLRLNQTATVMFGSDLERLSVSELPEKDEFIVEIEGRDSPCFLAFRRLEPEIFTLDDCTGDLVEAQDISWWAAVGRTWTLAMERNGQHWRREESMPADFEGRVWPCEWQGRFEGYLCVENPPKPAAGERVPASLPEEKPKRGGRRSTARKAALKKEDEVLKAIGPQTMGLLAPGQIFGEETSDPEPARRPRGRARKTQKDGA